jgi:hypothetical protein
LPIPAEKRDDRNVIRYASALQESAFNLICFQSAKDKALPDDVEKLTERCLPLKKAINDATMSGCSFGISLLNLASADANENPSATLVRESEKTGSVIGNSFDAWDKFLLTDNIIWDYMNMGSKPVALKRINPGNFDNFISIRNGYLSSIRSKIKKTPVKDKILFLPVFSNNEVLTGSSGFSDVYFGQLRNYGNLLSGLLWEGPVEYPSKLDFVESVHFKKASRMTDYLFINNLTRRREDLINDDNIQPGEARMGNIFEPLDLDLSTPPDEMEMPAFALLNQSRMSSIDKIRLITAADYLWNMKDYNPSVSAWKALVKVYGKGNAITLICFNDKYFQLLQQCMIIERGKADPRILKAGEEMVIELNSLWNEIKKSMAYDLGLLNEISDLKNRLIGRFYRSRHVQVDAVSG